MRIESIRIQNLRAFKDQTILLNPYTCLAGPNGGGKSTILIALNIFFGYSFDANTNVSLLEEEDFHQRDTNSPIQITVVFTELSPEAQADFSGYFRQGKLIITAKAEWNNSTRRAEVKQFGERLGMKSFAEFFKSEGDKAKVDELKKLYSVIRAIYQDLPSPGTKQAMIDALRDYESSHTGDCTPIASEDQFYGVSGGKNLLQKYIQWIFVPAVKDASSEQFEARKTALGQILERTVRSKVSFSTPLKDIRDKAEADYQQMLMERESELVALSDSLTAKFQDWAHPDATVRLKWRTEGQPVKLTDPLAEILAGEGTFEGQLARFGHGLQRSFLLTLLQELAGADDKDSPKLVLACEEPELFQHPPQVRHLASVFQKLTDAGSQVLVCTHSPLFVRGKGFEDVRLIRRDSNTFEAYSKSVTFSQIATAIANAKGEKPIPPQGSAMKVSQALQPAINEMFFTPVLILVEGIEDLTYINSYMVLTDRWDEFRRLGCHVVAANRKSSMIQPLAIAISLGIPTFVVFDCDTDKCGNPSVKTMHERDNRTLLSLCGFGDEEPLPNGTIWKSCLVGWKENIGATLAANIGKEEWQNLRQQVQVSLNVPQMGDLDKNIDFIGHLLAKAWDSGTTFASLDQLCESILSFAQATRAPKKAIGAGIPGVNNSGTT